MWSASSSTAVPGAGSTAVCSDPSCLTGPRCPSLIRNFQPRSDFPIRPGGSVARPGPEKATHGRLFWLTWPGRDRISAHGQIFRVGAGPWPGSVRKIHPRPDSQADLADPVPEFPAMVGFSLSGAGRGGFLAGAGSWPGGAGPSTGGRKIHPRAASLAGLAWWGPDLRPWSSFRVRGRVRGPWPRSSAKSTHGQVLGPIWPGRSGISTHGQILQPNPSPSRSTEPQ